MQGSNWSTVCGETRGGGGLARFFRRRLRFPLLPFFQLLLHSSQQLVIFIGLVSAWQFSLWNQGHSQSPTTIPCGVENSSTRHGTMLPSSSRHSMPTLAVFSGVVLFVCVSVCASPGVTKFYFFYEKFASVLHLIAFKQNGHQTSTMGQPALPRGDSQHRQLAAHWRMVQPD